MKRHNRTNWILLLLIAVILTSIAGVAGSANELPARVARFSVSDQRVETGDPVVLDARATDGAPVLYQWDTDGDGATDVVAGTPSVAISYADDGIYEVRLTIIDGGGCEHESIPLSITVQNRSPSVQMRAPADMARAGLPVTFVASASDVDGAIARWSWEFGDGATAESQAPQHTYSSVGSYEVRLVVTDDDGACAHSEPWVVTVYDAPPTASFRADETGTPLGVMLVDTTSGPQPESIASIGWDFGDGTYRTGSPSRTGIYVHEYAAAGTYHVTLYVIDRLGTLSTSTQILWIGGSGR